MFFSGSLWFRSIYGGKSLDRQTGPNCLRAPLRTNETNENMYKRTKADVRISCSLRHAHGELVHFRPTEAKYYMYVFLLSRHEIATPVTNDSTRQSSRAVLELSIQKPERF